MNKLHEENKSATMYWREFKVVGLQTYFCCRTLTVVKLKGRNRRAEGLSFDLETLGKYYDFGINIKMNLIIQGFRVTLTSTCLSLSECSLSLGSFIWDPINSKPITWLVIIILPPAYNQLITCGVRKLIFSTQK